jgi:hypothetical protein
MAPVIDLEPVRNRADEQFMSGSVSACLAPQIAASAIPLIGDVADPIPALFALLDEGEEALLRAHQGRAAGLPLPLIVGAA